MLAGPGVPGSPPPPTHARPCVGRSFPCVGCAMKTKPHQLLIQVAARLFADGHVDLAQDVRQLANKWTPAQEKRLVGGIKYKPPKRELK